MPTRSPIQRLHSICEGEEQQRHKQLSLALAELRRLRDAGEENWKRMRHARALISRAVLTESPVDRLAALKEVALAERRAQALAERLKTAELHCTEMRKRFLEKRIERRQLGALLDAERQKAALEQSRRDQQELDEWFRFRRPEDRSRK